jgi:hypothetical protein
MQQHAHLLDRMTHQIARWEETGDRRAIFLACYRLMTANMVRALDNDRFRDRAWVATLVYNFAEYYFVALAGYEHGAANVPEVWRSAHDLTRDPAITVVQNLLMGINAHINYDLVLVLDDMLGDVWDALPPEVRHVRYHDFLTINDIIGETIDVVQEEVVGPYAQLLNLVDLACGPLDEWLTARLIQNWRADVWDRAIVVIAAPDLPARLELRRQTDGLALQRVKLLTDGGTLGARVFGYPLCWLHRLRLL